MSGFGEWAERVEREHSDALNLSVQAGWLSSSASEQRIQAPFLIDGVWIPLRKLIEREVRRCDYDDGVTVWDCLLEVGGVLVTIRDLVGEGPLTNSQAVDERLSVGR